MNNALYEEDFYAWANEQARLLRAGNLAQADIAHIAEEIESVGRSERHAVESLLLRALLHLLKAVVWPTARDVDHWLGEARLSLAMLRENAKQLASGWPCRARLG